MNYQQIAIMSDKGVSEENIALLNRLPLDEVKRVCENVRLEHRMAGLGSKRFMERQQSLIDRGRHSETATMFDFMYKTIKPAVAKLEEYMEANPKPMEVRKMHQFDLYGLMLAGIRTLAASVVTKDDKLFKYTTAASKVADKIHPDLEPVIGIKMGRVILDVLLSSCGDWFVKELVPDTKPPYHMVYILRVTEAFYEWEENHTKELAELSIMFRPMVVPPRPWTGLMNGGYYSDQLVRPFVRNRRKLPLRHYGPRAIPRVYEAVNRVQATPFKINKFVLDVALALREQGLDDPLSVSHRKFIQVEPEAPHTRRASDIRKRIETLVEDLGVTWEDFRPIQEADKTTPDGKRKPKKDRITYPRWVRAELAKIEDGPLYEKKAELEANRFDLVQLLKFRKQQTSVKSKNRVILTTLETAEEYKDYPQIFFPHNVDWRGRIYPVTAGLTTQGVCLQKALLSFDKGMPLGSEEAVDYLKAHTAACWGYDKAPWVDRIKWTEENSEFIREVAEDPMGTWDVWKDADEPWLFIAACEMMVRYYEHGVDAVVDIPAPQDGTCNGAQHYAAMTRDIKGALGVNLIPNGTYQLQERLTRLRGQINETK